jgi:hypothetical protein
VFSSNWIIAIGSDCPTSFSPLNSARYDALDICNLFSMNWECKTENIVLMTGMQATTKNLKTTFSEILVRRVKENDRVLIYFSGHIDPDIRRITGSFVTNDYSKDTNNFGFNLRSLRSLVEDSKAAYIIVIIDGCYSGVVAQGNRSVTRHFFYFTAGEMDSMVSTKLFITAVSSGGIALQRRTHRNSDFTEIIISVLQEALVENDPLSTGLFFERIAKRAQKINIASPVRSGVEIGSSPIIFPRQAGSNLMAPRLHEYHIPFWLKEVFEFQSEKLQGNSDKCVFVRDNNLPDGSALKIGQTVVKSWRIRNAGQVFWENRFLKMIGEASGVGRILANRLIPLPDVKPGQEVNVEVELRMPPYVGSVYAEFKMTDSAGDYLFPEQKGLYVNFDVVY